MPSFGRMVLTDGLNSTISGNICGSHWTLTENGTVTQIEALIRNLTANYKARCSIYTYPATGGAVLSGVGHSNAAAFFVSIAVIIKQWLFKRKRKRLVAANVI